MPIVRAMIDLGKKPDGAFFAADEGMATNILASRLAQLLQARILAKKPYATDQRKEVYRLTGKRAGFHANFAGSSQWERTARSTNRHPVAVDCPGEGG